MFPDIPLAGIPTQIFQAQIKFCNLYFYLDAKHGNFSVSRELMMGVYENMIEHKADQLGWTTVVLSAVANRFGIRGASESNLSKAFNKTKELPTHETAFPLDQLLSRFLKMTAAFEPFTLQLTNPEQAKRLLEDFEAGRLVVSITRQEPGALIYGVYIIENLVERNRLFQGMRDGKPSWGTTEAIPIKDQEIANVAVKTLNGMNYPCRTFQTSVKTVESKIAKTLLDLGFIFEEKENQNGNVS